ncbi:MAG: uroporphyrinogen-III synthase [Pseudomonadota bacterium]
MQAMRVLVTRAKTQARRTAARLEALGHDVVEAPLLEIVPVDFALPPRSFDGVVITSANAVAAPAASAPLHRLPVFAMGEASAAAARAAGFADVEAIRAAGAAALYADLGARPKLAGARLLHLTGRDRTPAEVPEALSVEAVTAYAAARRDLDPAAATALRAGRIDWLLTYSQRSAAILTAELARLGINRARLSLATLGPLPEPSMTGWRRVVRAARPDEDALFAAAGLLCEKGAETRGSGAYDG